MSLTSYRAAPPRASVVGDPAKSTESHGPQPNIRCRQLRPLYSTQGPGKPGGDLLFRALRRSTIGAEGFHGRVRDGIGCLAPRCDHQAVLAPGWKGGRVANVGGGIGAEGGGGWIGGFERLVPVGCAGCPASTSGLSTWWSSTALDETWF
jgi:hypothetical protein